MIDSKEILVARNRFRKAHKVFMYEAELNLLSGLGVGSISDTIHAIVSDYLIKIGKKLPYLKERDIKKIMALRKAITQ